MITKLIVNVSKNQFIKNIKAPVCNDCYYYVAGKLKLGKCMKFGEKDIITGKINYENVTNSRFIENMCGIKGNYYQEK